MRQCVEEGPQNTAPPVVLAVSHGTTWYKSSEMVQPTDSGRTLGRRGRDPHRSETERTSGATRGTSYLRPELRTGVEHTIVLVLSNPEHTRVVYSYYQ
jgi:hypothetical protein